jgi:hypothetical protein
MSNSSELLEQGFNKALEEAATLDQQGLTRDADFDLFPDGEPSNVQAVKACVNFYHQHKVVLDAGLESALKFLGTPHGIADVKALAASFESREPNPLSVELASKILHSEEFSFTRSPDRLKGVEGVGIGVSLGAALPQYGAFAGADIVFKQDDVIPRAWTGVNGPDKPETASISLGLELSFFTSTPTKGVTKGTLIDVYVPYGGYRFIVFVRVMLIEQQLVEGGDFVPCGVSVQLPIGIDFAPPGQPVTAQFVGYQWTGKPKPQFATLTIAPNQIASKKPAVSLSVKLTNTSGQSVQLSKDDTITIALPSYFQPSDLGNMKIDGLPAEDWKVSQAGNKFTLTLNKDWTWQNQATIPTAAGFNITNVRTDQAPSTGDTQIGKVTLVLSYSGAKFPVIKNAMLNLVNNVYIAKILKWNVDLGQSTTFEVTPGQPSEGSGVDIKSTSVPTFMPLTTLSKKGSTDVAWKLVYKFTPEPRVVAVWVSAGGLITYSGQAVGAAGGTTSCFYQNTEGTYPKLSITVGPLTPA